MKKISDYTIYCTEEQTRKALELDAPIEVQEFKGGELDSDWCYDITTNFCCHIPTAEQMLGWLRSQGFQFHFDDETNYWRVDIDPSIEPIAVSCGVSEQKELAAVDAALGYLSNK